MASTTNSATNEKKSAAYFAVSKWLKNGQLVGIGSGTTAVFVADAVAKKVNEENLTISCIPTSYQALQLIVDRKLNLTNFEQNTKIDIAFDGVDEIDTKLNSIKGGGGCMLQEKIVAYNAEKFIVVGDSSKQSNQLGEKWKRGIPLEVIPLAANPIMARIEQEFGGTAQLRQATAKMGPVVTDNGNFIIDWNFNQLNCTWAEIDTKLHMIPGIVETGLFINIVTEAIIGQLDGDVKVVCP